MTDSNLQPKLETLIRHANSSPSYLSRNELRRDVLNGDSYRYYYVDIGKGEIGTITVNYNRISGKIFGKIVKKNQIKADENLNWRGIYHFPDNMEESLHYEPYFKQLIISNDDTKKCDDGCYLLISVKSSNIRQNIDDVDNLVSQPFSIMTKIFPMEHSELINPKVRIPINEYVIGNIQYSKSISEYYDVWLPFDAGIIFIDWQGNSPSLYINIGDENPSNSSSHFVFKSVGHDTLFNLTKNDILSKCEEKNIKIPNQGSIKDIHLVIGIWTEKLQAIYSVFTMKIHLAHNIDIYHVRSDQKVLCKPKLIENQNYRCLFAVIFDGLDSISQLSVLPRSQNSGAYLNSYANFVDQEYLEKNDYEYLKDNIPNKTANYTSDKVTKPYIFIEKVISGKSLYISVISDNDSIIELLTSTLTLETEIIPNPSTDQIFSIKNKNLSLNFDTNKDLLINVVSVTGDGYAYWKDDAGYLFFLQGIDDRLSVTCGIQNEEASRKLIFESYTNSTDPNDPGLMFYVTYYLRSGEYNCDLLKIGKSTEFNYRSTDFPINFIVPLNDLETEVYASFNFYGFTDDKYRDGWFTKNDMIHIWADVISEEKANDVRFSEYNKPKKSDVAVDGMFDGALNVAIVSLSILNLKNFTNLKDKNPHLFISLEKDPYILFKFSKITAEVTVLQESRNVAATEKVYQYGRIRHDSKYEKMLNSHILNINKK